MKPKLFGAIEFGGTKTICIVSDLDGKISSDIKIPTTSPDETISKIADFFTKFSDISSIGVASFGPVDIDQTSSKYGFLLKTPKLDWVDINLLGMLKNSINLPFQINTDVNCAAIGEYYYGAAKNIDNFIYLTIGTGIGGCLLLNGLPINGLSHSEMGHIRVRHDYSKDSFEGTCPYHGDCFEGLASGPAFEKRWGVKPEDCINDDAWDLEADYIAEVLADLILVIGPKKIVIGGGELNHEMLVNMINDKVPKLINNYIDFPKENYIVKASSAFNSSLGAVKIASQYN